MKIVKKPAGFWIRVLSIFIDLIIFCVIAISSSLIAIDTRNSSLLIIPWGYYVWMVLVIFEILILFIVIPILSKGRSIGMWCCQINLISLQEESVWLMVVRKNQLYAFLWIFSILVSMSFISPDLSQKMVNISKQSIDGTLKLQSWEAAMLAIPSTTSGIIVFINIFTILSINMNKNMRGINDKLTNTQMIYPKKNIEIFDEKNKVILKEEIKKQKLIWRN